MFIFISSVRVYRRFIVKRDTCQEEWLYSAAFFSCADAMGGLDFCFT